MSDYILIPATTTTWLTKDGLMPLLSELFPGTEFERHLLPDSPGTLWGYVPDGDGHTGEVRLDAGGRMLAFTDMTPGLVARIVVSVARRFPAPEGELLLCEWARDFVTITAETTEAELLAMAR